MTLDNGTFQAGANNLSFANKFVINAGSGTVDNNGNNLTLSGVISNGTLLPGGTPGTLYLSDTTFSVFGQTRA